MRTTKSLSKAYLALQKECMKKIKSFFKGQPYERIIIASNQHLNICTGTGIGTVTEINSNGDIFFNMSNRAVNKVVNRAVDNEPLPVDALLTVLDELERMKKNDAF